MSQYISKDEFRIFQNHSFYSDIGTHNLMIMEEGVDEGLYKREIQPSFDLKLWRLKC